MTKSSLSSTPRRLIEAELKPIQGACFYQTGFVIPPQTELLAEVKNVIGQCQARNGLLAKPAITTVT